MRERCCNFPSLTSSQLSLDDPQKKELEAMQRKVFAAQKHLKALEEKQSTNLNAQKYLSLYAALSASN